MSIADLYWGELFPWPSYVPVRDQRHHPRHHPAILSFVKYFFFLPLPLSLFSIAICLSSIEETSRTNGLNEAEGTKFPPLESLLLFFLFVLQLSPPWNFVSCAIFFPLSLLYSILDQSGIVLFLWNIKKYIYISLFLDNKNYLFFICKNNGKRIVTLFS